jgi:ribose transport system ATP-binding protein
VNTGSALQVSKVSKRYGATVALREASFTVEKGHVHALIGENGAGKSTLVKILSGSVQADEGSISVAGEAVRLRSSRDALAAGIATAFQELTLVRHLTVAQNIMLGRAPRNRLRLVTNNHLAAAAREILEEWDLTGVDPDVPVGGLSLSVRQQIELVRVLSRKAPVVLLDEPTAALGAVQVEWLFRQVNRLRDAGGTVVFISHRMGEVREICDEVTVLRSGHEVATFGTSSATDDEVVEMMIGRSVETVMAETGPEPAVGKAVLAVDELTAEPGLRGATFTLREGEILGVAALQGHGQFELFTSLFGARRATGGTISVDGKPLRLRSPHDAIHKGLGINLIPEDRKAEGVLLNMSGLANVTLPHVSAYSRFGLLNKRAERADAKQVFKQLNVRMSALDDDVSSLSGGNQQKLVLGKWMLTGSHIMLMYDPTRGVDIGTKTEIFTMMREFARDGKAIVFYSTDIEELLALSNRIIVLYRGRVVAELSREQSTRNSVLSAMLGSAQQQKELKTGVPTIDGAA